MKIIFLDIDGVVATAQSLAQDAWPPALDAESVGRVARLCSENEDVRVVISSSWRYLYTKDEVLGRLAEHGLPSPCIHRDWRTVRLDGDDQTRGDEIAEWLSRHHEVTRFVVLDDDSDFHADQLLCHVCTTFKSGFTESHFAKAQALLK